MFSTTIIIFAVLQNSLALDNGVALTPPMGWISWERYRCSVDCVNEPNECVSETLIKRMADLMVAEGYLDVGYKYLIVDDCWSAKERDEQGRLQGDSVRFSSGMKTLADYVHSRGLKFGLVADVGISTCSGYPGSDGYFEQDASTFAEWGVDYLKVLPCSKQNNQSNEEEFGKALNATGRPIVYSCGWPSSEGGLNIDYAKVSQICNTWRNTDNIDDSWESVQNISNWFGQYQDQFAPYHGPGHWNDPDMLIVGDFDLNYDESKSQMAIWSILAAPLLISTDLANIRAEQRFILQNRELIAINQDGFGQMGRLVYNENDLLIWAKIIADNSSYAIVILNLQKSNRPRKVEVKLSDVGLNAPKYVLYDLYEPEKSPPPATDLIESYVNPHGVVVYRATPVT